MFMQPYLSEQKMGLDQIALNFQSPALRRIRTLQGRLQHCLLSVITLRCQCDVFIRQLQRLSATPAVQTI
ncbi:hypothetical protein CUN61_20745 [Pseudomonas arsenicoxydans]|uniref:Uncharacterized protein n=1 Tax=Pseudomonas arsenicoxydans TaxID=702115 RepID=A0A4P6G428_9PSED|nr:hypothetical protein CUN61_20745 [Pseudomonas arsenicoxydans]